MFIVNPIIIHYDMGLSSLIDILIMAELLHGDIICIVSHVSDCDLPCDSHF